MKNFIFKSQIPSTYKKLFQSIEILNKNILYITFRVDKILKIVDTFQIDTGLQKQVDEYFEEGASTGLEDTRKTSHQTESDEQ